MKTRIPGLVIRETRISDLNSIYRLGLEEPVFLAMKGWDAPALADLFCSSGLIAFTASRKKEVLGFVLGRVTGDVAEIEWILVKAKLRNRGIGTSLLDVFVELSKNRGIMNILVALFPEKRETEAFFNRINTIQVEGYTRLSAKL